MWHHCQLLVGNRSWTEKPKSSQVLDQPLVFCIYFLLRDSVLYEYYSATGWWVKPEFKIMLSWMWWRSWRISLIPLPGDIKSSVTCNSSCKLYLSFSFFIFYLNFFWGLLEAFYASSNYTSSLKNLLIFLIKRINKHECAVSLLFIKGYWDIILEKSQVWGDLKDF